MKFLSNEAFLPSRPQLQRCLWAAETTSNNMPGATVPSKTVIDGWEIQEIYGNSTVLQVAEIWLQPDYWPSEPRNAARGSKEELLLSLSSVHEDSSETE